MADATLTTANAYLKEVYTPVNALEVMYHENPFFAEVPKDETFTGIDVKQPVIYGNPSGQSSDFATAQAVAAGSDSVAFTIKRHPHYAYATIQRELLLAAGDDKGAFLRATKPEFMGAMNRAKRALSLYLYRSGTGSLATVGSVSNTPGANATIVLGNARDVKNFEVGDSLVFSTTDGGGTVRTQAANRIVSVDRMNGTLTLNVPYNTGWSSGNISANDYIYYAGTAAGVSNGVINGLQAWLPGGGVTSALFLGVDRTKDTVRLAGVYEDNSAYPIEEGLLNLATDIIDLGDGSPDRAYITPNAYNMLVKELGSKVRYTEVVTKSGDVEFGFKAIALTSQRGSDIAVMPDYNCPAGYGFCLTMNTWKLRSIKPVPHWITDDGLDILRLSTSDSFEARFASYAELSCEAPGYNGQAKLAA